jgi:hypothetical protein
MMVEYIGWLQDLVLSILEMRMVWKGEKTARTMSYMWKTLLEYTSTIYTHVDRR